MSSSSSSRSGRRRSSSRTPKVVITRRGILLASLAAGSALVLGWGAMPPRQRLAASRGPAHADELWLNGWVQVGTDDSVTVMLARSEMGQGVATTLAMLLADEMDADWAKVRTAVAPVDPIYNNQAMVVDGLPFHPDDEGWLKHGAARLTAKLMREFGINATGGSSSIKDLWLPMRQAGASARAMLVAAAARAWNVPAADCSARQGQVLHPDSGRSLRFGELAERAARWKAPLPDDVPLKTAEQFTLIGRPTPRLETRAKQDGSARFGLDQLPEKLLYAAVLMSPSLGGSVATLDGAAAEKLPGVHKVLSVPPLAGGSGGVAVIADNPWLAQQALKALQVKWHPGPAAGLDSAGIARQLDAALAEEGGFSYRRVGDPDRALATAQRLITADFRAPLLAHATLEPQNCTVRYDGDVHRATVWAPTQVPDLARRAAAQVLGLDPEKVTVRVTLLGGGFGRRLETDVVAQAAAIARHMPGRPVQTFWSREQDFTHDLYRPPAVARWRAGFDAQGRLLGLSAHSAGPSVVHQVLKRHWNLPAAGPDKTTVEGAFDQPYELPHLRVAHRVVALPIPLGFWRSVGHSHQAFFKEAFMDECAQAAGQDALAFRLSLLGSHPRHRAVLQQAAQMAGWGRAPAPAEDGAPTALGLALHQSFGTIVAEVARVSVAAGEPRRIRVHEVWVAADCGTVVNPLLAAQQLEGGVLFGLSAALHGEITLQDGQVQQTNFHQQPLLRLSDSPRIHTHFMPSTEPPEGLGEPATPPIAPAVANALFALTGQRQRSLPLRLA